MEKTRTVYVYRKKWKPFKWPIASFRGKNNYVKARVFVLLYMRKHQSINTGLTAKEISELCPKASYEYLQTRLGKWWEWAYLNRQATGRDGKGRALYRYSLASRGTHFVEDIMPETIIKEIAQELRQVSSKKRAEAWLAESEQVICWKQGIAYWCVRLPGTSKDDFRLFLQLPDNVTLVQDKETALDLVNEITGRRPRF